MVTNFFFRSAVASAELWNLKMRLLDGKPAKRSVIFFDNGHKFIAIYK